MHFERSAARADLKRPPVIVTQGNRAPRRFGERAVNRAAQLLVPVLMAADVALRGRRKFTYGEE